MYMSLEKIRWLCMKSLSVVLFLGVIVFVFAAIVLLASYWYGLHWMTPLGEYRMHFYASKGETVIWRFYYIDDELRKSMKNYGSSFLANTPETIMEPWAFNLVTFKWRFGSFGYGFDQYESHKVFVFPIWFLMMLSFPAPFLCIRKLSQLTHIRHRQRHEQCLTCGYDLRATPDRCPECGTVVEKKSSKVSQPAAKLEE